MKSTSRPSSQPPGAAGSIGAVLGQVAADSKPNESPAVREPLEALAGRAGAVSTTDAPRARRDTAQAARARHADHAMTVRANTPALRSQLKKPPWKDVPAFSRVTKDHQGHGLASRPGDQPAAPGRPRQHRRQPPPPPRPRPARFINDKRGFCRVPGQTGASNPPIAPGASAHQIKPLALAEWLPARRRGNGLALYPTTTQSDQLLAGGLMPRNNAHLPQHERIDRVLAVATALFLENGYDATSIADIARGADLRSPAAVIWYFPTKEHILAAALERAAAIEEDALKARLLGPTDLFFAYLEDLREMRKLHTTMHERMSKSAVMLESHERLHAMMNARLVNLLADHELKYDLDLTMNVVSAVLEGAYVAPSASFTGSEMVRFVLGLLVAAPAGLDLKRPAGTIEARPDGGHDPGDGAEAGAAGAGAESGRDDGR